MPVNLDADIRNADWTKRSNDLPPIKSRAQLEALIRDIPHWLRDLPSANPEAVHSVWHLLTPQERLAYEDRELDMGMRLFSDPQSLVDNGSAVLSSLSNRETSAQVRSIRIAVERAFSSVGRRFGDDLDLDQIQERVTGLADYFLDELQDSYLPAVEDLVSRSERSALAELATARRTSTRSAARPSPVAISARRYALNRALRLVEDLSTTARTAARAILSRDDLQHATRVRRLRNVVGMNDRQHDSFLRSMSELESARGTTVVLGSFAKVEVPDEGLTDAEIHAAADRYAAHLIHQRSNLIALTEGVAIREEVRRTTWEREEPGARFKWVTRGATCAYCESLSGHVVEAMEPYVPLADGGPHGEIHTPPAHPGCDCTQAVLL